MEPSWGSKGAEESLHTALEWIETHLHMFGLEFWRRDTDRKAFPYGPLVELLQVLNAVPGRTLSESVNIETVISFSRRELTDLGSRSPQSAFAHASRTQ